MPIKDYSSVIHVDNGHNFEVYWLSTDIVKIPYKINGAVVYIDRSRWDGNVAGLMRAIYNKCGFMESHLYHNVKSFLEVVKRSKNYRQVLTPVMSADYFDIRRVIFNNPATIVFWADGTKTVVKCQDGDTFVPEKGLAMAITKRALGNMGNYCNELKKWLPEKEEDSVVVTLVPYDPNSMNTSIQRVIKNMENVFKNKKE